MGTKDTQGEGCVKTETLSEVSCKARMATATTTLPLRPSEGTNPARMATATTTLPLRTFRRNQPHRHPDFRLSVSSTERITFCVLGHLVYSTLLWEPQGINTPA